MKKSVRDTLVEATEVLKAAGVVEARLEAVSILMHALGVDRTFAIAHQEYQLNDKQLQKFRQLVGRRAAREPLQYITGHQEFFKLKFEVKPGVLIPRPETELVVEAALDFVNRDRSLAILEVGTGSGCIVVSLLHELKKSRAVATDISRDALKVAERNARRHNVSDRLTLLQADGLSAFPERGTFSLIVSNPPYVPEGDIESLQREVREHEPLSALVSGRDGLNHIRALLRHAPPLLHQNGYLVFEIGFGQHDAVEQLVDHAIWRLIEVRKDLQSIPRTFVLQKS